MSEPEVAAPPQSGSIAPDGQIRIPEAKARLRAAGVEVRA